jgi:hypothetical protein
MKSRAVLPLFVAITACAVMVYAADDKEKARKDTGKQTGLERFKQLAGDWTGKGAFNGKEMDNVQIKYKVTSNGTAVVETIGPGTEHEMVTVIHQDGNDLALTHYCALGNQPHMKARIKDDANKVDFEFTGASNLKSDKEMHMHSVTYTFVDKDTLRADWTNYNDGKKAGTAIFELKRKK